MKKKNDRGSRTSNKNKNMQKKLRVIPFGGVEEVGRNCMGFEYGNDIILIDAGLMFPEDDMPGIDYVIPDISYLKGKEKNVRGVVLTHAHYDHIGAVPQMNKLLGCKIPFFGTKLTAELVKKRQEEYDGKLNMITIDPSEKLRLGVFEVEFFRINHNIPDSVGVVINTPVGNFVHTGDWKFDLSPVEFEEPADIQRIAEIGSRGVMAMFSDSTNANVPGYQLSEKVIGEDLDVIFHKSTGRIITATFASLIARVQQIINLSEQHGRKVVIDGRSLINNIEICRRIGYIKAKKDTFITMKEANKLPDHKVTICCTGAQGERRAALARISRDEHKHIKLKFGDSVVFSSSAIPGNEGKIEQLMDALYRRKAMVYHYKMMDIHAGGHARQEDIKMMTKLLNPKYYVPIEGNHFLLVHNAQTAKAIGYTDDQIFLADNGQVIEFDGQSGKLTNEFVGGRLVTVEGTSIGEVGKVVLNDRIEMSEGGIFVVVCTVDKKTKKLLKNPDITTRGFIYVKEAEGLLKKIRSEAKAAYEKSGGKKTGDIKNDIKKAVQKLLYRETKRESMIVPLIIET